MGRGGNEDDLVLNQLNMNMYSVCRGRTDEAHPGGGTPSWAGKKKARRGKDV